MPILGRALGMENSMIVNRYMVSAYSNGRYLEERLFTSFNAALNYATGFSLALLKLHQNFSSVFIYDRKTGVSIDYMKIEGIGCTSVSSRLAKKIMKVGGKKHE